jgi:hypothetical protein
MPQENVAVEVNAEVIAAEASETVQAAYDRIANPGKVQEEVKEVIVPTAEKPLEPVLMPDEIKELRAQVARIPELEKRLRDEGGRYGILKQSLEQIQQRIADKKDTSGASDVNVDEILADIKKDFGEDGELYAGLRSAFSKIANGRGMDPDAIKKIASDAISEAKQTEYTAALGRLAEAHPTWEQDRETPELKEWTESLSAKERNKFYQSNDPDYVADRLDQFQEWKAKKVATPEIKEPPKEEVKPETKPGPSKRLTSAVLPTNGTKPKTTGEDSKSQVRAAYERVAGNRR